MDLLYGDFTLGLLDSGKREVDKKVKERLAGLPDLDVRLQGETSTISTTLKVLANSLADVLAGERRALILPDRLPKTTRSAD